MPPMTPPLKAKPKVDHSPPPPPKALATGEDPGAASPELETPTGSASNSGTTIP